VVTGTQPSVTENCSSTASMGNSISGGALVQVQNRPSPPISRGANAPRPQYRSQQRYMPSIPAPPLSGRPGWSALPQSVKEQLQWLDSLNHLIDDLHKQYNNAQDYKDMGDAYKRLQEMEQQRRNLENQAQRCFRPAPGA